MKRLLNLVVVLSALMLVSCADKFSVEDFVPENAVVAAKCDFQDIYLKSFGDGSQASQDIIDRLKEEVKDLELAGGIEQMFLQAIDNPVNAFGLDLSKPVVLSATSNSRATRVSAYLAMAVSDVSKTKEMLNTMYDMAEEESNINYGGEPSKSEVTDGVELYYFGDACDDLLSCAVSDDFVLFYLASENDEEDNKQAKRDILKLLQQEKPCTALGFDNFLSSDKSMDFWMDLDFVGSLAASELSPDDMYTNMLLGMLDGMTTNGYVDFQKGKTTLGMKTNCPQETKELLEGFYSKPSAKYFSYLPQETVMACNMALNNDALCELWDELSGNFLMMSLAAELEEAGIDRKFIEGLPGTVTLGLAACGDDIDDYGVVAAIECDERAYETLMDILMTTGSFKSSDEGYEFFDVVYSYDSYEFEKRVIAKIKYENGALIAMMPNLWNRSDGGKMWNKDYSDAETSSLISGGGYAMDFSYINEGAMDEFNDEIGEEFSKEDVLGYISSVVCTYNQNEAELIWNMGDKEHTILQKIIEEI